MPAEPPSEDLVLVQRILAGERQVLARLSERLRCLAPILRVLNMKHGCVLGEDELADLAQDVLVIAWRKLPEYQGLVPLEGWVHGICALELMNTLRRKRRLRQESGAGDVTAALESAPAPAPWDYEDVHAGLERIAPEEARVIRLKHFEERTFEEIGRLLGLSPNTVKARYYRGLVDLRPLLRRRMDTP